MEPNMESNQSLFAHLPTSFNRTEIPWQTGQVLLVPIYLPTEILITISQIY